MGNGCIRARGIALCRKLVQSSPARDIPFSFGLAKARLILENLDAIRAFVGEPARQQAAQPDWMKRGLQQTATGYGRKLNTGRKIAYNGREYRLYATCYSNNASVWFTVQGKKIYVS